MGKKVLCLAFLGAILLSISASAQTYVRFVAPSDLGTKVLYSDDVLSSIILPHGVSRIDNNQEVRDAAFELMDILRDPDLKLLRVYVCGSASPDGLWQNNEKLSEARTKAAADYLHHVTGIPMSMINQECLYEDWDRLYELVEDSDMPYREEVLYIIRTKDWGERKTALQSLAGGKAWRVLLDDFFPQLRCVRIGFYCLWDSSKPYLRKPEAVDLEFPDHEYDYDYEFVPSSDYDYDYDSDYDYDVAADTVYVRDTVVYMKETLYVPQTREVDVEVDVNDDVYLEYRKENKESGRSKPVKVYTEDGVVYDSPLMMGFKTNLLMDGMIIPDFGMEFQLGKKLSLDINGWYTNRNVFYPGDYTNAYGFSPEFRWWFGNRTMQKGHFLGIHANFAWYSIEWMKKDGTRVLYQNGLESEYTDVYAGHNNPAWSFGLTYGYSLALDRKGHWGLEFVAGLGYINAEQNVGLWSEVPTPAWYFSHNESRKYFGITKLGINLTYRFSLRKVTQEYYDR